MDEGVTEFEVKNLENLQHRCPVCNKPFIYRPIREEVVLGYDGNYVHLNCVEVPRD